MDQKKIGKFIQELRKEKGLNQEQFAEQFGVNRRTVSRWETGTNLPDLDILLEMADYCEVELRQLLNGERSSEAAEDELDDTVQKVVEYSNEDKLKIAKRMHWLFIGGFAAAILYMVLVFAERADNFLGGLCLGITDGMMLVGVIMTSKSAAKIRECKMRIMNKR